MENHTRLDVINHKTKKNKGENKQTNIKLEIEGGLGNYSDKDHQLR